VLDSHDTALDGGSAGAEGAGLPVQCPFPGKIGLLLRDPQTGESEKDSTGDICSNQHPCAPQSWIDPPILPHYLWRPVTNRRFSSGYTSWHTLAMGRGEKPKKEKKKPKKK